MGYHRDCDGHCADAEDTPRLCMSAPGRPLVGGWSTVSTGCIRAWSKLRSVGTPNGGRGRRSSLVPGPVA
jgi:hypothetical protein